MTYHLSQPWRDSRTSTLNTGPAFTKNVSLMSNMPHTKSLQGKYPFRPLASGIHARSSPPRFIPFKPLTPDSRSQKIWYREVSTPRPWSSRCFRCSKMTAKHLPLDRYRSSRYPAEGTASLKQSCDSQRSGMMDCLLAPSHGANDPITFAGGNDTTVGKL